MFSNAPPEQQSHPAAALKKSATQLKDGSTIGPVNELIDAIVKGGEVKGRQEGKAPETMREKCLTLH
ncbi:MAG: hypothetical protein CMM34_00940 [Rhodospirillaceae bacterium]|nr:hypothetical protein [Rhodospirillaceae bacterium]